MSKAEITIYPYPKPFDDPVVAIGSVTAYIIIIGALHQYMQNRKPYEMRILLGLHNLFLCILSLIMTVGLLYRVVIVILKYGVFSVYCGVSAEEDQYLFFWANMFYLSKYYELVDTVFVVLRKKPLTFLHLWHHCAVVFVSWLATRDSIVMGWITVLDNTSVHVMMYYYYAIQSLQRREVWWRKYLTTLQIVQFFIDMVTSVVFIYYYTQGVPCKGTFEAWIVANMTGFSFFVLFLQFYSQTYSKKKAQ